MKEYNPVNITETAKKAAEGYPDTIQDPKKPEKWTDNRIPSPNRNVTESRRVKVRGSGTDSVSLNHESVELRFVEQVVDNEQTNLLGAMLRTLEEKYFNSRSSLTDCVNGLFEKLKTDGFSAVCGQGDIPGNYAMVRIHELWAMVNRYRGLQLKQP